MTPAIKSRKAGPLAGLKAANEEVRTAEGVLRESVKLARAADCSWEEIGEVLGLEARTVAERWAARIGFDRDNRGTDLEAIQIGRNFVRPNDIVRVKPSAKGKRDGFEARVNRIIETATRTIVVDLYGGPGGKAGWRTLPLSRIERVAQTVNGKPRSLRKGDEDD